jgi:flagellar assembly protein FliH
MSDRVIAKEHLPELSAWQAFSFDPPSLREMPVKVPTASEIEAMHQAARDEGYRDGLQQAKEEMRRLATLNDALAAQSAAFEGDLAEAVLGLSLTLARQMVREAIAVRPELLLPVVRDALAALVSNVKDNVLRLHPSDLDLVRRHLADDIARGAWRLVADDSIEAGGCRIDAANGRVDATLAERWSQALAMLGRNDSWLI